MSLSMENIQKLQSIKKRFRFSITIYEKNGTFLSVEGLEPPEPLPYSLSFRLDKKHNLSIQYGNFNEVFLFSPYKIYLYL